MKDVTQNKNVMEQTLYQAELWTEPIFVGCYPSLLYLRCMISDLWDGLKRTWLLWSQSATGRDEETGVMTGTTTDTHLHSTQTASALGPASHIWSGFMGCTMSLIVKPYFGKPHFSISSFASLRWQYINNTFTINHTKSLSVF